MTDTPTHEVRAGGPRFSIAMPAYNASATIAQTIESVIAQTLHEWELVIVDDGSADSTGDIARGYAARDPRIRVVRQQNAGCGPARGSAIELGSAPLVARLDADDQYVPTYLEEMASFIDDNPDFEIYSCNGEIFFPGGSTMLFHRSAPYDRVMSLTFRDMARVNGIFSPAVFRRSMYDSVGGFKPDVYTEDYDLWMRAMAKGARHIYLPRPLVLYRVSEGQMSTDWLRAVESEVDVLSGLLRSGTLDDRQAAAVRAGLRRRWRLRARKAFQASLEGGSHRPMRDYMPKTDDSGAGGRALFVLAAAALGFADLIEQRVRALVSSSIAALRRVLPFLRDVKLRRGHRE